MSTRKKQHRYTKQALEEAVNVSDSIGDVLRYFDRLSSGGSRTAILKKIKKFGIDTSHFTRSREPKTKIKSRTDRINNSKTRTSKPIPRYSSVREYDFLKYIRVVFKWAMSNYDLSRIDLDMLLYLYPEGPFSKSKFSKFHKILGIHSMKTFDELVEKGWLTVWRPKQTDKHALYTLTNKGKKLCDRMHKFCTGELKIPTSATANKIAQDGGPRINNYYMNVIKKMNKDRKRKQS